MESCGWWLEAPQIRFNEDDVDNENWGKPIIPITNGYGYMDMAWSDDGAVWAGGGNGTLLVSRDNGDSWERDPEANQTPTNFNRFVFDHSGINCTPSFLESAATSCAGLQRADPLETRLAHNAL